MEVTCSKVIFFVFDPFFFLFPPCTQFVQILMDSKSQSKLGVLDIDDVKQKTSLFSVQGKSACFRGFFVLFFYMSSTSVTQNIFPNSHHNHPVHLFNT